jgi:hypothetical protein
MIRIYPDKLMNMVVGALGLWPVFSIATPGASTTMPTDSVTALAIQLGAQGLDEGWMFNEEKI